MSFQVHPISAAVVADARVRLRAGDPTVARVIADASPGFPCRRCLCEAAVGEPMLLFRHRPFVEDGPYAESGAILAHEQDCAPPALALDEIPEVTRVRAQCVVRAYDARHWIADGVLCDTADAAETLRALFSRDNVAYAHVRNVGYGCFAYRVERA